MDQQRLRFRGAAKTHPGRVRPENEDQVLARPDAGLWAVADGMGGHANGRWASQVIADALTGASLPADFDGAAAAAAEAIHAANRTICDEAARQSRSMGSTVAALLLRGGRSAVLWVGDSRVYRLRGGALRQLTVDHSLVQEMVAAGQLAPEEAADHPLGHVLSRAVGARRELRLDTVTDGIQAGDVFLVCSDGLTRAVSDDELAALLADAAPVDAAERLVELCLARGAPDNVSVAVVACDAAEPALAEPAFRRPAAQ